MLRPDFVKRKISLIQDDLVKLATFSNFSLEEVAADFIKQAAVERILERIITRAIDVNQHLIAELANQNTSPPKDYRETFFALADLGLYPKDFAQQISKSIGTRNVLVHEYDKTDHNLIYESMKDCLRDYRLYADYVLKFLDAQKAASFE